MSLVTQRSGGAGEELWSETLLGDCLDIEYVGDDVSHELCGRWAVAFWLVRSPGGDEWIEDLSGEDPETGAARARKRRTVDHGGSGRRPGWWC